MTVRYAVVVDELALYISVFFSSLAYSSCTCRTAGAGNTLNEPTQITLGLEKAELDLFFEVATQEEAASALTLSQVMAQPAGDDNGKALSPCAAVRSQYFVAWHFWKLTSVHFLAQQATISALGLRDSRLRFEVSAPLVVSQTGGSVEAGLGDLISNAIGIANDLYLADLPAILDGILARNVTSLVNTAARSWLETAAGVRADNPELCEKGASSPDAITGQLICCWVRTLQGNASTLTYCLQTP